MRDEHDDRRLISRVAGGDVAAFETLVRRWETPLFRFLRRVTGSAQLAEDARQLTFVRVYTRASTYRGGSPSTWLFRTAYRVGLNARRDESRRARHATGELADVPDRRPSPAEQAVRNDQRRRVTRALDRLDDDDRVLVWLRVAEDLSFEALSGVLDVPASTLRYRLVRALRRLRRHLAGPPGSRPQTLDTGDSHAMR